MDTTEEYEAQLRRATDNLCALPYRTWFFGDSLAFEAMLAASEILREAHWAGFVRGFTRKWASETQAYSIEDSTAPGVAMVDIAEKHGDGYLMEKVLQLAEFLDSQPRIDGVLIGRERAPLVLPRSLEVPEFTDVALLVARPNAAYIDCLAFVPPLFASLGKVMQDLRWSEVAIEQACGYIQLFQKETGLFDHFVLRGNPESFGTGWGRGQGLALHGLLNVIERSDASLRGIKELREAAGRVIASMIKSQLADGQWSAVIGDVRSDVETSTAAFMSYCMPWARRLGIEVPGMVEASERAFDAMQRETRDGLLKGVSEAVGSCTIQSHYRHIPTGCYAPWGQSALVLGLAERIKRERSIRLG